MGRGKKIEQLERGCTSPRNRGKEPHYRCPSESYNSLRFRMHVDTMIPPTVTYYYQPFSSMDILNWQRHAPQYSEEPHAMSRLMETIFWTHRPTWDDIIQLLVSLFSPRKDIGS